MASELRLKTGLIGHAADIAALAFVTGYFLVFIGATLEPPEKSLPRLFASAGPKPKPILFSFHVMASLAQMEWELTVERTRASLETARKLGRKGATSGG